jgi:hypothetical protein
MLMGTQFTQMLMGMLVMEIQGAYMVMLILMYGELRLT